MSSAKYNVSKEKSLKALFGELETIEDMLAEGVDIMPQCISTGQDASIAEDGRRFLLGALVNLVDAKYGEQQGQDFAKNVGKKYGTVMQYGKVVSFYGLDFCLSTLEHPVIRYSHLRVAMARGSAEAAIAIIEQLLDEGRLTVEELEILAYGKNDKSLEDTPSALTATKVLDLQHVPIDRVDAPGGTLTLYIGQEAAASVLPLVGHEIQLKIKMALDATPRETGNGPVEDDIATGRPDTSGIGTGSTFADFGLTDDLDEAPED